MRTFSDLCIRYRAVGDVGTCRRGGQLEDKTSNLQSQLEGINQDLVTISNEIAETEVKIEESNNEVFRLEASLQISRNNEEVQYANMKTRIKYMYENGSDTLLSMICEAKSMGEFLNRVDLSRILQSTIRICWRIW
mgnify:CR=1 FL=1